MISFIIPTRNEESVLQQTLERLRKGLTTIPHEIIVSDGNSTDRTIVIAEKYADRVVVETDPVKRTIARGKNLGAQAAQGAYLVFLDADTCPANPAVFFTKALSLFDHDAELTGLTVRLRVLPEMETIPDRICFAFVNLVHIVMNNLLHLGSGSGEFQMMRTADFQKIGGYREDLVVTEDMDMFYRLAKIGKTRLERSLTVYHTGRRAHAIGWPRLLYAWWMNAVWSLFFHRAYDSEWKPIR